MLAEQPLEGEAETDRRPARGRVQGVAFPFEAPVAQGLEGMARHQEDRLGGEARALQGGGQPDMADFDHTIGRHDPEITRHAQRTSCRAIEDGEEQRVRGGRALGEPGREGRLVGEGAIAEIIPDRRVAAGAMGGLEQVMGLTAGIDRHDLTIAPGQALPAGGGCRLPVEAFAQRPGLSRLGIHRSLPVMPHLNQRNEALSPAMGCEKSQSYQRAAGRDPGTSGGCCHVYFT